MRLTDVVAENLRTLRVRKKLTQQALAAKAGLSASYVSLLELRQRSPPLETIGILADALGISPVALFEKPHRR